MSQQQQGQPNRQQQQTGQNFPLPSKQNVQSMIHAIEDQRGENNFTCSADQANDVLLPALRTLNQQLT